MLNPGDIILAKVQFTDRSDVKTRPAVVLYEEFGNVVIAGITSNSLMKGIKLSKKDGAVRESVIKLNYIFTVSDVMISKVLFRLNSAKRNLIFDGLCGKLERLVL